MNIYRKRERKKRICIIMSTALFLGVLFGSGGLAGEKYVQAAIEKPWKGVGIIFPNSLGDRYDDAMRAKLVNYDYQENGSSYQVHIDYKLTSLGTKGNKSFTSTALFYDADGNLLNQYEHGYFQSGDSGNLSLDKTYSSNIFVPVSYADKVAKIVFQEHYTNLNALPVKRTADLWDHVDIQIPNRMGCMLEDAMQAKITNYDFYTETGAGDYILYVNFNMISLGSGKNTTWASIAIFYDSSGNVLNEQIEDDIDGLFGATNVAMDENYMYAIHVRSAIAKKVSRIVFQETYTNPISGSGSSAVPTAAPSVKTAQTAQTVHVPASMKKVVGDGSFYLYPSGDFYTMLNVTSSNKKVATVTSYGSYVKVSLKKAGTTKITVTAPDTSQYYGASATLTLKVGIGKPKLKVKIKGSRMTIQWGKVKGASKYKVSIQQHGVKTTILPLTKKTKLSNTIRKKKKYTIKVQAIDSTKKYKSAWAKKTVKS